RGLRDRRRAGKSRPVVDDHLLIPGLAQLLGDGAGEQVRNATGTEVHDDAHRLVGIGLRILRGGADASSHHTNPSDERSLHDRASPMPLFCAKPTATERVLHLRRIAYLPCGGTAPTRTRMR